MRRESQHAAGIVLYRHDGERRYLLLRSALTRRPVWEFPKGGIEQGEVEQQAAERELQEERYFFTRGSGAEQLLVEKRVTYFLAEWRAGEVRLSPEATRYHWASYDEAVRLLRFPQKRRVLEQAERWLSEGVR